MLMNVSDTLYEFQKRHHKVEVDNLVFLCRSKFVFLASLTPHNVLYVYLKVNS